MELMKNVQAWTEGVEIEWDAMQQIRNIAGLPIVAGHIAVMPDVHLGKGATVGTVVPTRGAIIPAAVGVDIGCGMAALRTQLKAAQLPESLMQIRSAIEAAVPVGFDVHDVELNPTHQGPHGRDLRTKMQALYARFETLAILTTLRRVDARRIWRQLGTLGGGNHFIELCLDEAGDVWVMLHSGSRNIGKTIGEAAIGMAREAAHHAGIGLPDKDLAWLNEGTAEFNQYVEALQWAQDYAALNRELMLFRVLNALRATLAHPIKVTTEVVNCHHNYATIEEHFGSKVWITRKGAVSAREGQLGIIPGSMGTRSYIVRGRGNPLSYCSCSHGAGRRMSRGAAKRHFNLDALAAQTAGVECRKDAGVLDEIPGAYKDIDAVMAAQADLVEVVHTLKQVLCVKG
ncbi:RtcB family protein [Caenimonas koreensis DSM 17982]|uniref:3'-phosphate/5'-hydroxy nucleic acid ligase n=1 Tax=Caenimonas koreensis DSM 17982 TaxID=1121255 RepID=A0A844BEP7_9BURK|nr:RtcB family protein [Caenimonas koreensis]MRD48931.1 RtcB family protein [Caenimonas koreensis DSM 17982]